MKHFIKFTKSMMLILVLALSLPGAVLADEIESSEEAHVYPVLPGSDEWRAMSLEERLASCEVSTKEVEGMTTSALVETVLNYPFLINIYAYNSIDEGIERVSSHFPALPELISRSDGVESLQNYCSQQKQVQSDSEPSLDVYNAETLIEAISNSMPSSTPRITNTTLYTPRGSAVPAYIDTTWNDHRTTQARADQISTAYLGIYPSAKIIRTSNPKYNCHSYAWHSTSANNRYWIDNPAPFVTDGSYTKDYAGTNHRITYRTISNNSYIHSGIITSTAGGLTTVSSKWGNLALFSHEHFDCPYLADSVGTSVSVEYWK